MKVRSRSCRAAFGIKIYSGRKTPRPRCRDSYKDRLRRLCGFECSESETNVRVSPHHRNASRLRAEPERQLPGRAPVDFDEVPDVFGDGLARVVTSGLNLLGDRP